MMLLRLFVKQKTKRKWQGKEATHWKRASAVKCEPERTTKLEIPLVKGRHHAWELFLAGRPNRKRDISRREEIFQPQLFRFNSLPFVRRPTGSSRI